MNAVKFYMTKSELDYYKEAFKDNPERLEWIEKNIVQYDVFEEHPTLLERLNERHGKTKEAPALNRADRRRLRHTKARG